jgi:hypothetical protein
MAAQAQFPKAMLAKVLDGTYDVTAATLGVALMDDAWTMPDVDDDALIFDSTAESAHIVEIIAPLTPSWAWEGDLRARTLVLGAPITWTPGSSEDFLWLVVFDTADTLPPLSIITFPSLQTASSGDLHTLELDPVWTIQLWASSDPHPVGNVESPVVLVDTDGVNWRVTAIGGALGSAATSETDPRQTWLTAPDASLWRLVVDTTGTVGATSVGTLGDDDRIFDSTLPCILPSEDVTVQYVLSVDNAGALSVA